MANEQIMDNRRAWQIMSTQYDGIEKWQRQVVYEWAIEAGMSHEDALAEAHGRAKGRLPDVVFQADESCDRSVPSPPTKAELERAYHELRKRERQCSSLQ